MKEFVFAQAAISGGSMQRNELIEEIVGEAAIMSVLQHPRILHLYGCSLTSQVTTTIHDSSTEPSQCNKWWRFNQGRDVFGGIINFRARLCPHATK